MHLNSATPVTGKNPYMRRPQRWRRKERGAFPYLYLMILLAMLPAWLLGAETGLGVTGVVTATSFYVGRENGNVTLEGAILVDPETFTVLLDAENRRASLRLDGPGDGLLVVVEEAGFAAPLGELGDGWYVVSEGRAAPVQRSYTALVVGLLAVEVLLYFLAEDASFEERVVALGAALFWSFKVLLLVP